MSQRLPTFFVGAAFTVSVTLFGSTLALFDGSVPHATATTLRPRTRSGS